MTEKKFRFLEQLDDDLRDAAARERVAGEGKAPEGASRSSRGGDGQWTRWIAAAVVVLVVAGGVGAFVQYDQNKYTAQSLNGKAARIGASGSSGSGGVFEQHNQPAFIDAAAGTALEPVAAPRPALGVTNGSLDAAQADSIGSPQLANPDLSKVIRQGAITVELPVGKFAYARDLVTGYAGAAGGYVVSSSARGGRSGTFVLRIPAKKFDAVMQQLERMPGGTVLLENSTGQDVTAEFVDSGAELQILRSEKAATLRYLKNAGSLSQAIQFRNQAFQIQGEIDKLQGRLNYLANQVSLSTITVNLREVGAPSITRNQTPVQKPSLVRAWDRAVGGFLGVISAVIVGLGYLIPLGILALLIGLPIMVLQRKRRVASSTP